MPRFYQAISYVLPSLFLLSCTTSNTQEDRPKVTNVIAELQISSEPSRIVPGDFMGFSHEWGNTMSMIGYSTPGANIVYRQLISNLTAYGSDPINLRIGGNSTDNNGRPSGDRMRPYSELSTSVHSRFIFGVNLGSNDLALAQNQVEFYLSQMPKGSIEAFEIGNEPDHYIKRKMRPEAYNVGSYRQDFELWTQRIRPMLPKGISLAGPSWGAVDWVPKLDDFLDKEGNKIGIVSLHFYAGNPYSNPPADFLLKPNAAKSGANFFRPAIEAAHKLQIPVRITELNSFYGVGLHGLSDAFSAALWSVDTMFEYAQAGVDGVNWEADGGNFCSPFLFNKTTLGQKNSYSLKIATPLYYGLLFFQAATGKGARLLPVDLNTHANLKAWATVDSKGQTRLALINKDETTQGNVVIKLSGYTHARVLRLVAPSYTSLSGVTFGGQTLDESEDGKLTGSEKSEIVRVSGGAFNISMPMTSAALITFSK